MKIWRLWTAAANAILAEDDTGSKGVEQVEFRVLEYYLIVAREENITKAAELLHITQPTLSRQLSQMEEELGVKLFQRRKHSISLTEDGLLLKRRAQEIVEMADKTKQELRHEDGELGGTISIGSGELKSMHTLGKLMKGFRRLHPQVDFDIYSSTADHIKERIEKGLTDIGLLTEPVEVGRYQFIRVPQKARWGVLIHKDNALAQKKTVQPADLLGIPVILPRRDSVKNEAENWFGKYYDDLEIAATYNLLYNAAIFAEELGGAVFGPEYDHTYENMIFIPVEPKIETGSVLVWKKSQFFSPATAQFIEYIRNAEMT